MPTLTILAAQNSAVNALPAKPPAHDGTLADAKSMDAASFAAHFQRLAAKQGEADPLLVQTAEAAQSDAASTSVVPAVLIPVLDGLGRMQQNAPAAGVSGEERRHSPAATPEASAAWLALPVTPAAAAANSAAGSVEAAAQSFQLRTEIPGSAGSARPEAAFPVETQPGPTPSAGREFASSLTQAISTAQETQSPGATAAAVQQAVANLSPAQSLHPHPEPTVSRPVGAPGWAEEVGSRVAWIAGQGQSHHAELVLNPPQMGRIEVNLTLNGDQATASFASSNPVVREALEAALPRLREVLADAGIQLGQAQVGAEHARQQAQQEKHGGNPVSDPMRATGTNAAISPVSLGSASTLAPLKFGRGLVDVFA